MGRKAAHHPRPTIRGYLFEIRLARHEQPDVGFRDGCTRRMVAMWVSDVSDSKYALRMAERVGEQQLKEARNPAHQSFERTTLVVIDDNNFEAVTNNNLESRFIDQQRLSLCEHLQAYFNNRLVSYTVKIDEHAAKETFIENVPLNSKQQFQKLIEKYPLVLELKDRLRLELDY